MELNNINYWPGQSGYDYHITQQIAAWSRLSTASIYRGRPLVIKRPIFLVSVWPPASYVLHWVWLAIRINGIIVLGIKLWHGGRCAFTPMGVHVSGHRRNEMRNLIDVKTQNKRCTPHTTSPFPVLTYKGPRWSSTTMRGGRGGSDWGDSKSEPILMRNRDTNSPLGQERLRFESISHTSCDIHRLARLNDSEDSTVGEAFTNEFQAHEMAGKYETWEGLSRGSYTPWRLTVPIEITERKRLVETGEKQQRLADNRKRNSTLPSINCGWALRVRCSLGFIMLCGACWANQPLVLSRDQTTDKRTRHQFSKIVCSVCLGETTTRLRPDNPLATRGLPGHQFPYTTAYLEISRLFTTILRPDHDLSTNSIIIISAYFFLAIQVQDSIHYWHISCQTRTRLALQRKHQRRDRRYSSTVISCSKVS